MRRDPGLQLSVELSVRPGETLCHPHCSFWGGFGVWGALPCWGFELCLLQRWRAGRKGLCCSSAGASGE